MTILDSGLLFLGHRVYVSTRNSNTCVMRRVFHERFTSVANGNDFAIVFIYTMIEWQNARKKYYIHALAFTSTQSVCKCDRRDGIISPQLRR